MGLAAALGLTGTPGGPTRHGGPTTCGDELVIRPEPGWPWSYRRRRPRPPGPAKLAPERARIVAAPILVRLALGRVRLTVLADGAAVTVLADPVLARLPSTGYGNRLVLGPGGELLRGSGWLGRPVQDASHPLVDARAAIGRLDAVSDELDSVQSDIVITGAEPGLVLRHDSDGAALLVPAWLYTVQGRALPLAAVSVASGPLATVERGRRRLDPAVPGAGRTARGFWQHPGPGYPIPEPPSR
ncbi:hypothetical protein BH20ACT5_BH20ACT5_18990 [soil metagenome]